MPGKLLIRVGIRDIQNFNGPGVDDDFTGSQFSIVHCEYTF